MMKSEDLQPRLLYIAKLSFNIEKEIKSFPGKKRVSLLSFGPEKEPWVGSLTDKKLLSLLFQLFSSLGHVQM